MIYITGDCHGDWGSRFSLDAFPEQKDMTRDDFYRFAIDTWRKKQNLNVFKSLHKQEYGVENGKELYDVFKGHIRIIDKIR